MVERTTGNTGNTMNDQRYRITKPSTSEDDGTPSDSCLDDIKRVFRLIDDERHLIAQGLYHNVLERLYVGKVDFSTKNSSNKTKLRLRKSKSTIVKEIQAKDMEAARDLIKEKQVALDDLDVSGT